MNFWKKENFNKKYFSLQLIRPKESTKEIFKIFTKLKINNLSTLDLACGNGANLIFLKRKFKNKKYCLGYDSNKKLIKIGLKSNTFDNLDLKYGNILNLNKNLKNKFKLITSFQTLSWLKDYERASREMIKLNSNYIFISSLFWEGLIDFNIKLNYLKNSSYRREINSTVYYNIYSLKNFIDFYKKNNFKIILCKKFTLKKNIKNKFKNIMGTYTLKSDNKNIQISGPILMNWYFLIFKKIS